MATLVKDAAEYARSINPPRRAKRPRHDDLDIPAPAPHPLHPQPQQQQRPPPPILPKDAASRCKPTEGESSDEGEDDYDPSTPAPAPKRRGRKPGTMSRSARESQRKLNHSRIEKARRTKINETLATLSNLVNDAEREKLARGGPAAAPVSLEGVKPDGGKQGEKEFKLDVLVKAVSYVQELLARVRSLESQQCSHCAAGASASANAGKRKRTVADDDIDLDASVAGDGDDVYVGDDEQGADDQDEEDEEPRARLPSSRYSSVHPTPSPRLPPIASWLPHPYVDPSCIAAISDNNAPNAPQPSHLPSPPMSGTFRAAPAYSLQSLPSLTLPGPARPLPSTPASASSSTPSRDVQPPKAVGMNRRMSHPQPPRMQRVAASPSVSPTWTPEDERAASMLLQMSSSPRSGSTSSSSSAAISALKLPQAVGNAPQSRKQSVTASPVHMQVQTPSSMLGM